MTTTKPSQITYDEYSEIIHEFYIDDLLSDYQIMIDYVMENNNFPLVHLIYKNKEPELDNMSG